MANNFLNQLQMVVDTGKLQGVTNIKDLYEHFKDSGINYKDFKKQMHNYGIYGHLGKHDMARLSGMYYGSKKADWEAKKPQDLARIEKRTFAPAFNLNTPKEISPLNIPVTEPVIQKTVVTYAPKKQNKSNKQQIAEVTKVVIPANSGDPNNFGIVKNTSNSPDVFTGNRYYVPGVKTREFEEWIRNHPNYWRDQLEQEVPKWSGYQDIYNYFNSYENPYSKGYMSGTQSFQQGGKTSSKQDVVMEFVQNLAKTLQMDPNEIIAISKQYPEILEKTVKTYQDNKEDIQKAAQTFTQELQTKIQAKRHGSKLNYVKSLKNQCADDEELYYYKKGGSVGCGCKKKEQGGELKEKKESTVSKFKKACGGFKVKFMAGGQSPKKKNLDQASKDSIEINDNQNMGLMSERPGKLIPNPKYDKGKTDDRAQLWVPDRTKTPYKKEEKVKKDCGGSKMKLKKGDKVCPKCGKVHAAGTGCSVAKFKYRKLGGQL